MAITYSDHALDMLVERGIDRKWVERTLSEPESVEPDPHHGDRWRAYRTIPERDGRVLRVVYAVMDDDRRVITVFLDGGKGRTR